MMWATRPQNFIGGRPGGGAGKVARADGRTMEELNRSSVQPPPHSTPTELPSSPLALFPDAFLRAGASLSYADSTLSQTKMGGRCGRAGTSSTAVRFTEGSSPPKTMALSVFCAAFTKGTHTMTIPAVSQR